VRKFTSKDLPKIRQSWRSWQACVSNEESWYSKASYAGKRWSSTSELCEIGNDWTRSRWDADTTSVTHTTSSDRIAINISTEELQILTGVFKRNANELKKKMWWKNIKVHSCSALYLPFATVRIRMVDPALLISSMSEYPNLASFATISHRCGLSLLLSLLWFSRSLSELQFPTLRALRLQPRRTITKGEDSSLPLSLTLSPSLLFLTLSAISWTKYHRCLSLFSVVARRHCAVRLQFITHKARLLGTRVLSSYSSPIDSSTMCIERF
jgi:hypothetical protein